MLYAAPLQPLQDHALEQDHAMAASFPRGKACRGCSVWNLGHTRTGICLLLSFLELSAIGIRHRIKAGAAGHGGRARVVHGLGLPASSAPHT